jgi:hypothetical protein
MCKHKCTSTRFIPIFSLVIANVDYYDYNKCHYIILTCNEWEVCFGFKIGNNFLLTSFTITQTQTTHGAYEKTHEIVWVLIFFQFVSMFFLVVMVLVSPSHGCFIFLLFTMILVFSIIALVQYSFWSSWF